MRRWQQFFFRHRQLDKLIKIDSIIDVSASSFNRWVNCGAIPEAKMNLKAQTKKMTQLRLIIQMNKLLNDSHVWNEFDTAKQ